MSDYRHFLPYQIRWLKDKSAVKIWEKSRRIGATYVQSYEDVEDCIAERVPAVWFSSADESAAKEYIDYCAMWVNMFQAVAENLGQVVIDSNNNIKAFVIQFANGTKIHALSSNPKAFRSKGGKVVLDEFAHHDNPDKMWTAAKPCTTWGFPLRILSTHNGTNCLFYKFVEAIKKGKRLRWSLHTTTIHTAVNEGLVDKIYGHATTKEDREGWLKETEEDCFDTDTWLQEYCCIAVDEASAFLTYEMLSSVEMDNILCDLLDIRSDMYLGMDIGRRKDLSVIWLLEKLGHIKYTRKVIVMEKTPFHIQRATLEEVMALSTFRRGCIDETGLGMQLAEEALLKFGKYRVEPISSTNTAKEFMAYGVKNAIEDRELYIPSDFKIREDLHSIKKFTTAAGHIRFDVAANSKLDSHADRFWGLALANHAATNKQQSDIPEVASRGRREAQTIVERF